MQLIEIKVVYTSHTHSENTDQTKTGVRHKPYDTTELISIILMS